MEKVCVLGTGSWGSALGLTLAKKGYEVSMWTLNEEQAKKINTTKENIDYLPGVLFPNNMFVTTSLEEGTTGVDINNFTYAIVNEEALQINVELIIEGLEKIEVEEESEEDNSDVRDVSDEEDNSTREEIEVLTTEESAKEELPSFEEVEELPSLENITVKEEVPVMMEESIEVEPTMKEDTNNKQVMDSIFSAFANTDETYSTYSVYILREDDNLEEVMSKYNTNREALSEYNDLDNLKVGAKLIIPTMVEVSDK